MLFMRHLYLYNPVRHQGLFSPAGESNEDHHAEPLSAKQRFKPVVTTSLSGSSGFTRQNQFRPPETELTQNGRPQSLVGKHYRHDHIAARRNCGNTGCKKEQVTDQYEPGAGSALASTGPTIPAASVYSLFSGSTVLLGISTLG